VKIWDAATGHEVRTLKGHRGEVRAVCFSPDGKRLASAAREDTLKVWDARTGKGFYASCAPGSPEKPITKTRKFESTKGYCGDNGWLNQSATFSCFRHFLLS
jgi:WD40 repeat protein